jgi:hypothetical protein
MDLTSPQYHVKEASTSSRYVATISVGTMTSLWPVNHPWELDPNGSTHQPCGEQLKDAQGHPPPWPPP